MKTLPFEAKVIGVVISVMMSLTACVKDEHITPDTSDSAEYLISEVWVGEKLQHTRIYDHKNRLESITMYEDDAIISRSKYYYNEKDLLTQTVVGLNSDDQIITTIEYDDADRPLEGTVIWGGQVVQNQYFTYGANQMTLTLVGADGSEVIQTYRYDDEGNMVEILTQNGSIWIKSEFGDFDDKRPFDVIDGYEQQKHNPRYEKETRSTGEVTESIYEYKYNEAGYIIESSKMDKKTNMPLEKVVYKLIKKK